MALAVQDTQSLKNDLRRALSASELFLEFQPLINLETNCVTGFEALLRWNHPVRGLISPADFIPLAEQAGLIVGIGDWVLQEACRWAVDWPADISVSVNLSPVQFQSKGLVEAVKRALRNSGLSPHRLQLEITENVLLQNSTQTHDVLTTLRALGIRIAMDDFGLGYSSLSYLQSFPFDTIKIDRSFITNLPENPQTMSIVRAVLALGQALGISTTAEGVESEQQASVLREMGCLEGQGYLFSKAVLALHVPDVLSRLSERKRNAAICGLDRAARPIQMSTGTCSTAVLAGL